MQLLYNIGISFYGWLVRMVAPYNRKAKLLAEGQRTLFDSLAEKIDASARYCWFHASSLGEFEQGRPLMEALRRSDPSVKIILTFFSPSGYEVRKAWEGADVVSYLPYDTPRNVTRFLDLVRPEMAVFIKYEFWANYLKSLRDRSIRTYLVSGIFRPTQLFFRPYGGFYRQLLTCFTRLYLQDEPSRELLVSIGILSTRVCGDTRFDRVRDIRAAARPLPLAQRFVDSAGKVMVVGSSWPTDESFLLPYINERKDVKLIIAPHEIHEEHLRAIESQLTGKVLRYSKANEANVAGADCLLIDCFGLLSSLYRYGTMAYIGGGFGAGIHNVTEAAVYGIPVVFGPKNCKFREAAELKTCRGGFEVADGDEFARVSNWLFDNRDSLEGAGKASGSYIAAHAGATEVILKDILAERR